MSEFMARLNAMAEERRLYSLRTLGQHLHASGYRDRLYHLLVDSPDWMNAKSKRLDGDNSYVEDLELTFNDFEDPLTAPDLLILIQLFTARQVVSERANCYWDLDLQTLCLIGEVDRAINYALLKADPAQRSEALAAICLCGLEVQLIEQLIAEAEDSLALASPKDNEAYGRANENLLRAKENLAQVKMGTYTRESPNRFYPPLIPNIEDSVLGDNGALDFGTNLLSMDPRSSDASAGDFLLHPELLLEYAIDAWANNEKRFQEWCEKAENVLRQVETLDEWIGKTVAQLNARIVLSLAGRNHGVLDDPFIAAPVEVTLALYPEVQRLCRNKEVEGAIALAKHIPMGGERAKALREIAYSLAWVGDKQRAAEVIDLVITSYGATWHPTYDWNGDKETATNFTTLTLMAIAALNFDPALAATLGQQALSGTADWNSSWVRRDFLIHQFIGTTSLVAKLRACTLIVQNSFWRSLIIQAFRPQALLAFTQPRMRLAVFLAHLHLFPLALLIARTCKDVVDKIYVLGCIAAVMQRTKQTQRTKEIMAEIRALAPQMTAENFAFELTQALMKWYAAGASYRDVIPLLHEPYSLALQIQDNLNRSEVLYEIASVTAEYGLFARAFRIFGQQPLSVCLCLLATMLSRTAKVALLSPRQVIAEVTRIAGWVQPAWLDIKVK